MKFLQCQSARIPALGFGTYTLQGAQCTEMVRYALDIGYRHIDTATMYDNENAVGAGLRAASVAREEIFLTTKVWYEQLAYADLKRSAENSLRALGVEYIDLLLIHWPNSAISLQESLTALQELQQAGKTRHIGVSNFPVALLREAIETHGAQLLCDQVEYHPYLSQRPVLDYLPAHDMFLTAYLPLAKGKTASDDTLLRIGQQYGKSGAQVALRWFMEQPNVAAIPKAAHRKHCQANLDIFDFSLSEADMSAIAALNSHQRMVDPAWAPAWDVV